MPNHVHMIIEINNVGAYCIRPKDKNIKEGACNAPLQKYENNLSYIIRGIKGATSKKIGKTIWQRNYYEHIIRNEKELEEIIQYIEYNPISNEEDY